MKKIRFRYAIILFLVIGGITGCGGSTAAAPAYTTYAEAQAAPVQRAEFMQETVAADGITPEMGGKPYLNLAADRTVNDSSSEYETAPTADVQPPQQNNRKLIRTASLSVESTEFDVLLSSISQTVTAIGGYLEQSDISGSSITADANSRRSAFLIARVPADSLDSFIAQVGEQGNITNKSESIQDVTLQYSDVESRKKSLTIEQERLWELLEKADTMEAVVALEARLSEIRYQLESFESQLRIYDNQVDYSTVTLSINEVRVFSPTSPDSVLTRINKGFSRNLSGVGTASVNFFVWLISSLPVLIVLGAIVTIIVVCIRTPLGKLAVRRTRQTADSKNTRSKGKQNKHPQVSSALPPATPETQEDHTD